MRKSWSAKGFSSKRKPALSSTRLMISKEFSSDFKIKTSNTLDLSKSTKRPITARTLLGSSKSVPNISEIEIESLTRDDIQKLYAAKCKDLDIAYIKDQESRFFNFCSKSFSNRSIGLNQNGLGIESIKIISSILRKNTYFCRLNLSKNYIGDEGIISLGSSLKSNKNIISVDISSNNINVDGSTKFFESLKDNQSIVYVNISSLEGLHRNRLGVRGAEAVGEFLKKNRVLTHLNIGDTGIGKEGLEYIIQGIAHNKVLISLDITSNGFFHHSLDDFCGALITTNLKELFISGNKIGNKGCEILASKLIGNNDIVCPLNKLNMSMCDISYLGVSKIFESLENNVTVEYLNLDNNPLGPFAGSAIGKCFGFNITLKQVYLNNCNLKDDSLLKISEGLARSLSIKKLSLCKNSISDTGAMSISEVLSKNTKLQTLDLSSNSIKNKGGISIANSLRKNSNLESLFLNDNSLKDESGQLLAEISRFRNNLLKIELSMNPINLKYIKEIKFNLSKNNLNYKQLISPRLKNEIEKISSRDLNIQGVFDKMEEKIKEEEELKEKFNKLKLKLQNAVIEEKEKLLDLKNEYDINKKHRQDLVTQLEEILLENTKFKLKNEKLINDISEAVAFTAQDIIRLEKNSKA